MQFLNERRVRTMAQALAGLGLAMIAILSLAGAAQAAEPLVADPFAATYGGTEADEASAIQQTADGGYILAGSTESYGAGGQDAWLTKLHAGGVVAWSMTYGGAENDGAHAVVQTTDGGYILAGTTQSFGAGLKDAWVLKLNAGGTVAWQKTYGGTAQDEARAIQQTGDGGYVVAGLTESSGAGLTDAWVLKLDANGGVTWQKTYGGTGSEEARAIRQTADDGYIVAAIASSFGPVLAEPWILKLNSNGSLAWNRTYSDTPLDNATDIQQTDDGGYVVAGYAGIFLGSGTPDAWVLKLNVGGGVVWKKSFADLGQALSIQQTAGGGYVVAGYTGVADAGSNEAWVLKLMGDGGVAWSKSYGGIGRDQASAIQQTAEGGYIAAGSTGSFGAGSDDAWILKLGGAGEVYGGCDLGESSNVAVADGSATVGTEAVVPEDSGVTAAASSATVKNPAAGRTAICTPGPAPAFSATYGGIDYDDFQAIAQTADGGYIVAGLTESFGAGSYDAWVIKLDAGGRVDWQKNYGATESESFSAIQQTGDGGYIVVGTTESSGSGGRDAWVLKLEANGNIAWQKTYGGTRYDTVSDIQQTRDGGYIVAGATVSNGADGSDVWVFKLAADGALTWQETYGERKYEEAFAIQQTGDGGYIVSGVSQSLGAGGSDAWILKLDAAGAVEWQETLGLTSTESAYAIQQTGDGGYIMAGYTRSFGAGGLDVWVIKLDADGDPAWQKTYGGTEFELASAIRQTGDGGYIVAGSAGSFGAGREDGLVLKLDASGDLVWQKTYGGPGNDNFKDIQQTGDGGYIVTGYTESFGAGGKDVWVLKLDANGSLCPGCALGQPFTPTTGNSSAQVLTEPLDTDASTAIAQDSNVTAKNTGIKPDPACACGLSLSKSVTPAADVAFQGIVTYTLVLSHGGELDLEEVWLTDTLPAELEFQRWVVQPVGALAVDGELTWHGALGAGQSVPFVFRAKHVGDYEDVVINTAQFACSALSGSAEVAFGVAAADVEAPGFRVYLPVIQNNQAP